jgi:hypothetical protein
VVIGVNERGQKKLLEHWRQLRTTNPIESSFANWAAFRCGAKLHHQPIARAVDEKRLPLPRFAPA